MNWQLKKIIILYFESFWILWQNYSFFVEALFYANVDISCGTKLGTEKGRKWRNDSDFDTFQNRMNPYICKFKKLLKRNGIIYWLQWFPGRDQRYASKIFRKSINLWISIKFQIISNILTWKELSFSFFTRGTEVTIEISRWHGILTYPISSIAIIPMAIFGIIAIYDTNK